MPANTLKIGFISSSDFCLAMATALISYEGKTLNQVLANQANLLDFEAIFEFQKKDHEVFDLPIQLGLVVSQADTINRNKTIATPTSIWALENKVQLWRPVKINQEFNETFDSLDVVITASFGSIISEKLLIKPKFGFINWHPSLLPKYRGPTPMQSTIVHQEEKYGLSWITMTKGMDEGKILLQYKKELDMSMDFFQMSKELGELGAQTLAIAIHNQIVGSTYCSKISKQEQLIEPKKLEAREILARQKAYIHYPGTIFYSSYFGGMIKILDCCLLDIEDIVDSKTHSEWKLCKLNKKQIVYVECKGNTKLQINKIQLENGKQLNLSGYQF
jgi:methionyl-tRNA formyltransferase